VTTTRSTGKAASEHGNGGKATSGKRRALVVAINDYGGPPNDLPSCLKDAREFIGALRDIYVFPQSQIRTLFDAAATTANLNAGLAWLVQDARPEDRLVFFYSGHGYTKMVGDVMEEFLVLRDPAGGFAFYEDDLLVQRIASVPAGTLTTVLDSCFSGGMFKLVALPDGSVEAAQNKAFVPPPEAFVAKDLNDTIVPIRPARAYKRWGASVLRRPETVKALFAGPRAPVSPVEAISVVSKSADGEAGDAEIKGLLISACLETETASASTSRTNGLSAFTHALLKALETPANRTRADKLFEAAKNILRTNGFRQTPLILESKTPGNLKTRSFVLLESSAAVAPASSSTPATGFDAILEEIMRHLLKETETTSDSSSEKSFGNSLEDLARQSVEKALAGAGGAKAMDLTAIEMGEEGDGEEKFLGALIAAVVPTLISSVVRLARRQKDFVEEAIDPEAEQKFLGGLLASIIPAVMTSVLPEVVRAVTQRRKDLGADPEEMEAESKFLGGIIRAVAPRVIATLVPVLVSAIGGRRKELGLTEEAEEKFLGGLLAAVLPTVVSRVIPGIVQLVARRKAIGEDPAEQAKFLGGLLRMVVPAIGSTIPHVLEALLERRKEFDTEVVDEEQEKFIGGLIAAVLPAVASSIVPELMRLVTTRHKAVAASLGVEEQEKLFGILRAAVPDLLRRAVPLLVDQAVRAIGGGKEIEAEKEASLARTRRRAA
jgi:hypothetical protein